MTPVFSFALLVAASALALLLPNPVQAQAPATDIGIVLMHGKGGSPDKHVNPLAQALRDEGYQVANLDMPWSGRRQYDVDMNGAVNEITAALDAMRAKGVKNCSWPGAARAAIYYDWFNPDGPHNMSTVASQVKPCAA